MGFSGIRWVDGGLPPAFLERMAARPGTTENRPSLGTPFPMKFLLPLLLTALLLTASHLPDQPAADNRTAVQTALRNGEAARQGFIQSRRFLAAWLSEADPASGLIPRNLRESKDIWNANDAAADNYPFMVLVGSVLDHDLYKGRLLAMLRQEEKLTSRIGRMPDTYSFSKKGFAAPLDTSRVFFGAAEYMKDGLLPLTEWLGASPWSERMLGILDDFSRHATVITRMEGAFYGNSPVEEVNGDLLQVLSRMYWFTGQEKYLDWAIRIGDHYLLGNHHPTGNLQRLRLRDHGGEIVEGLCELYATVHFARPEKKRQYQRPIHQMVDRLLEVGTNTDGFFYDEINPVKGEALVTSLADTWGYIYDGIYTVYLIDSVPAYRQAVTKVLGNLPRYVNYDWEKGSADGYADAIEGALNLYNREPSPALAGWIDSQIQVLWAKQQPSGIIEGWHGDGNFARTTMMYCFWKTQGVRPTPWREDLVLGAERRGDSLIVSVKAEKPWSGTLQFDPPRARQWLKLPIDWPRINQFPEWYPVLTSQRYTLTEPARGRQARQVAGDALVKGLPFSVGANEVKSLVVAPASGKARVK